jgi:hypothetical protein
VALGAEGQVPAGPPRAGPGSWSYHPALRSEVTHRPGLGGMTCAFMPKESHDLPVSDSSPGTDHWDMLRSIPGGSATKPEQSHNIQTSGMNPADRVRPVIGMAGMLSGIGYVTAS